MIYEMKVIENVPGKISINYEEFKLSLSERIELFKNITVLDDAVGVENTVEITDEGIMIDDKGNKFISFSAAKKLRADLNNVSGVIDTRRKDLKKDFLKPYELVELQSKELIGIINEATMQLDRQVKDSEEKERQEKLHNIYSIWKEKKYTNVEFSQIFNDKWTNKGYTLRKIEEEIQSSIEEIDNNLSIIDSTIADINKCKSVKAKYLSQIKSSTTINTALKLALDMYQQEELKLVSINKIKESSCEINQDQVTSVDNTIYHITFSVTGTKDKLMKLSDYLKSNNFDYKTVKDNAK